MILLDLVQQLNILDREHIIYAAEPWSENSQAMVLREAESGGLPLEARRLGLKYFLEVFIACEFIEDWTANVASEATDHDKCLRLIHYATFDA